ncbi:adenylate/guanylate cyclase domain-containing protein [Sanyastnella coralliicola]|uniref:adenylate/guanylate cyclase domain-containing protein n=1 Tax=Sanyastnella coralliicola TaxID=3069118 RepID=UPI0027B9CB45|nr:adenylate/guanylate cyclase domain-containing protein [Longitalea sp. SCSIO 12813]
MLHKITYLFLGLLLCMGTIAQTEVFPLEGIEYDISPSQVIESESMRFDDHTQFPFHQLSQDQNLPINIVLSLHFDNRGLLWIGGFKGQLVSFDGVRFKVYSHLPCFTDKNINCFANDKEGNLWIGTAGHGIVKYDGQHITEYSDKSGLPGERMKVLSIFPDDQGRIWFGTNKLGVFCIEGDQISFYQEDNQPKGNTTSAIAQDEEGSLWYGSWTGNISINKEGSWRYLGENDGIPAGTIRSMFPTPNGMLVVTNQGLALVSNGQITGLSDGIIGTKYFSAAQEFKGYYNRNGDDIWLTTLEGELVKYTNGSLTAYGSTEGIPEGKKTGVAVDPQGNVWFGSIARGLIKLENEAFQSIQPDTQEGVDQTTKAVTKLRSGEVLVSNEIGDIQSYQNGALQPTSYPSIGRGISYIGESPFDQSLILGTNAEILIYDGSLRTLVPDEDRFLNTYDVVELPAYPNALAIATSAGLLVFEGDSIITLDKGHGLRSNTIYDIEMDDQGFAWCATADGLSVLSPEKGASFYTIGSEVFSESSVLSSVHIEDSILWIGTNGGGLYSVNLFDLKKGDFTVPNPDSFKQHKSKFPDLQVLHIHEASEANTIYFSTRKGLVQFNTESKEIIRVFEANKEIPIKFLSQGEAVTVDETEQLWLGDNTLFSFRTENAPERQFEPWAFVESVDLYGREINWRDTLIDERTQPRKAMSTLDADYIHFEAIQNNYDIPWNPFFGYDQNHLTFHFDGFDWVDEREVQFSYFLEGVDRDWSKPSKVRSTTYQSIPPGEYKFQVRAVGSDGHVGPTEDYWFTIDQPFWKTTWFLVACLILAAITIYLLVRWRTYRLRIENEELEEKVATRTMQVNHERKKAENLLLNILPKRTADELKENGKAQTQTYENVSVLFSDFAGFTSRTQTMDPNELVMILDSYFQAWDEGLGDLKIEKIKTIGDAYMCAAGLPAKSDTHAMRVCAFALYMLDKAQEINTERSKSGKEPWDLRIGINSGQVIAGVVGKKKFAYDIWGDTVNTASRMESESEAGRINITAHTYELIQEYFQCEYRGKIEVKGKGKLDMYWLIGFKEEFADADHSMRPNPGFLSLLHQEHRSVI